MNIFRKKKPVQGNILSERTVPAILPAPGEALQNKCTSEYPMCIPEVVDLTIKEGNKYITTVLDTCDHYSSGTETDKLAEGWMERHRAEHADVIAQNENQISRIRGAIQMRKEALTREIEELEAKASLLREEIEPLRGLRAQFDLHLGSFTISLGLIVTILAAITDGLVNYSFLSSVLYSNTFLLFVMVAAMSFLSDGCMYLLGFLLSRRKFDFMPKAIYWTICGGLLSMFLLSVVGSVMIRYGSMNVTYAAMDASGGLVAKESYTLAEYGTTMLSAFLTTATGLASFGLSVDENAVLVKIRTRYEKELDKVQAGIESKRCELSLLNSCEDPAVRDHAKREAAEQLLDSVELAIKLHARRYLAAKVNDPGFTEKMGHSIENAIDSEPAAVLPSVNTVSLNKIC